MHTTAGAIVFTVIAILSLLSYAGFRSRIPLTSLLLQVVMDIAKHHKSVYVVAMITLVLQASLSVYVAIMLVLWIGILVGYLLRWYSFTVIATYVPRVDAENEMLIESAVT